MICSVREGGGGQGEKKEAERLISRSLEKDDIIISIIIINHM